MYCTRSRKKSDLMYQYARHLCWIEGGGPSAFGVCIFIYALVFPYIFLLNSEEITLCSDNVMGVHLPLVSVSLYMHWYFLIFSY